MKNPIFRPHLQRQYAQGSGLGQGLGLVPLGSLGPHSNNSHSNNTHYRGNGVSPSSAVVSSPLTPLDYLRSFVGHKYATNTITTTASAPGQGLGPGQGVSAAFLTGSGAIEPSDNDHHASYATTHMSYPQGPSGKSAVSAIAGVVEAMNLAARGQGLGPGSAQGPGLAQGGGGMELHFGDIYDQQPGEDHTHGAMISPMHARNTHPVNTHPVNTHPMMQSSSIYPHQASPPYQYPHRSPSDHSSPHPASNPTSSPGTVRSPGTGPFPAGNGRSPNSNPNPSPGPSAVISSFSPRPKTDRRPQSSPSALVSPSSQQVHPLILSPLYIITPLDTITLILLPLAYYYHPFVFSPFKYYHPLHITTTLGYILHLVISHPLTKKTTLFICLITQLSHRYRLTNSSSSF